MKRSISSKILSWAAGLVTLAAIIFTAAAFAALQSQPGTLRGNTIQTAVASLQVSSNGTTYGSVIDGYAFSNLLPGGQPSPVNGYQSILKISVPRRWPSSSVSQLPWQIPTMSI